MRRLLCVAIPMGLWLSACSPGGGSPSSSAAGLIPTATPAPRTAAGQAGGTRTVLTPLGLRVHAQPSLQAPVEGVAAWGAPLAALSYTSSGGGWYQVRGASVTGWISADPSLSAAGTYTTYSSSTDAFAALYPDTWTYAEGATSVVFRPQAGGDEQIIVTLAGSRAAFGQAALPGYTLTSDTAQVVCGYTGDLLVFQRESGTNPPPRYALIRLVFGPASAMQLRSDFASADELSLFATFYDSLTFAHPLCQQPATPAPVPT